MRISRIRLGSDAASSSIPLFFYHYNHNIGSGRQMQLLKADVLTKVVIGPVVAVGDGFTPITTLSLSTADESEALKHDSAAVTDISSNVFAAITSADGYYNLTITAAQLDTEGRLTVLINDDSLCLPVRCDFMVVNANVYDSLYAADTTDYLKIDAFQVAGTTQDATDLADFAAAGYDPATNKVQGVVLVDTTTTNTEIGAAGAGLTDLGGMSTGMKAEVNVEADTALTDYDGPTNAEMEARTPTAAQLAYIVSNAATGLPVTFTTAGGSTTVAVINQVDSSAGSAVNDQYNGRLLVFTDGTLKGVVTDITDYTGSTTTATITAIPTAPTSSHNARLI